MSKFKVGDHVRAIDNHYCITSEDNGWEGVVTAVHRDIFNARTLSTRAEEPPPVYTWYSLDEAHFERVPKPSIHIYFNNRVTTAILKMDDKKQAMAISQCSTEDTYDVREGVRIALERLYEKAPEWCKDIDVAINGTTQEKPTTRARLVNFETLKQYGYIGVPTKMKDAVGRPLCSGDVVELWAKGSLRGERVVISENERDFVMGIAYACNPKTGYIDEDVKVLKKRSFTEIHNGERINGIQYVLETEA